MHEGQHDSFQLGFAHLPVTNCHARSGNKLLNPRGNLVNGFHAIVYKVDLSAALQLQLNCRAYQLLIELGDNGLNRHAILRRRLNHAHVAQAHQRHVQRARDGRGTHGQHVKLFLQLFEAFFVAHAKALLLIHDKQAEILELDVLREQAVRADEHVDLACFHLLHDELLFLGCAEARDHFDLDGEHREALLECLKMLEAQHCRGRQHGYLLAILYGFEGCAHGHFRLAVTHVSAEQAIHGRSGFHVLLDGLNGRKLIVGFGVVECVFKLALKFVVRREGCAFGVMPFRVKLQQLVSHVLHGLAYACLGLGPLL